MANDSEIKEELQSLDRKSRKKTKTSDAFMKDAIERFDDCAKGDKHNRTAFEDDTKFARMGEQWPDEVLKQREDEGRPALVINKLPALIRAVVNEARQNRPAMKIAPVDNGADVDHAQVVGGLLRSIEEQSNAAVAYNTAIDNAVTGGMGFWRVDIDYAHEDTFELEARINRIANPLTVHYDQTSTKFDASDWAHCFVSDFMSRREYERRFPDASYTSFQGDSFEQYAEHWLQDDQIRIAEYFLKTPKTRKIMMFGVRNPQTGQQDMQTVREDQLPVMAKQFFLAGGQDVGPMSDDKMVQLFVQAAGLELKNEREVEYNEVVRHLINGVEELEEKVVWPGANIPIIPVWGDEVFSGGRRHFRSLIRDAKDSQRMFNYWRSASTELVALAPKAPWVGPSGFVPRNKRDMWAQANIKSYPYLEYDGPTPPQRQPFPGVPAGNVQQEISSAEDLKNITGIFDASVGARSNETSGKAILARERQGDVSNFHFIDNLARSIQYSGKVLLEILPSVYSARQSLRILGEDQKENIVNLTQAEGGGKGGENGKQPLYNISIGKYDVTVSTGPSFGTQREETRETLTEIIRVSPDQAPILGPEVVKIMDFVGADKVAKKMEAMLPPQVRAVDELDEAENPEAAQLQQQLQAMQQQQQQMIQQVKGEMGKLQQQQQQTQMANEGLKANKRNEQLKIQADSQLKSQELELKARELTLKESQAQAEAMKPDPDTEAETRAEMVMQEIKQTFEADQRERDRQLELAKMLISKQDQEPGNQGEEAMVQAAALLAAPKRVVRDESGLVVGVETLTNG